VDDESRGRSTNITAVHTRVTLEMRARRHGHKGGILWFTGLPSSGKSTLAVKTEKRLFDRGYQVYVLDGDNIRQGLSNDLGFLPEDRVENIRRVGELAALFADAGFLVVAAFISPYCADRDLARRAAGEHSFHEVYIKADLKICESRDPKGHYKKARAGEIENFTGISAPYEVPSSSELVVNTTDQSVDSSLQTILDYVERAFPLEMPSPT